MPHESVSAPTAAESTALRELKAFLNQLFQFESQELDFGIYKILHHKRAEIRRFIDELLTERVREQLLTLSNQQTAQAQRELDELAQTQPISRWLAALAQHDATRIAIYEEDYKTDIRRYRELETLVRQAQAESDAELRIYNHLTLFFSRYYDRGDFVSKRRFGKNEKYVVPYNGEETHFYWANHDQYYIKSAEHFQHFAFRVPHAGGTLTVQFKLTGVQTEQGNVKADEARYFVLADREPEWADPQRDPDTLAVFFEYRPLTEAEKKTLGAPNKQDRLDADAALTLETRLKSDYRTADLWRVPADGSAGGEGKDARNLLLRKLNHYTRANSYDFFIHKDLRGFLRRELDFYIKSELVLVDDLYVLDTDLHFERVRGQFRAIKVFKNLADAIIDLLAQIEDFQRQLWEKKKFVLGTDYVVSVDRLVGYLGEPAAAPLLEAALANDAQRAEWRALFGPDVLPRWDGLTPADLQLSRPPQKQGEIFDQQPAAAWRKLPIDTAHFGPDFKDRLLNALADAQVDLDDAADGLVLHSDNFHGLTLLQEKYREQVKCIYIDPPYNTSASEIIYKNSFKHSSWNSLIVNRLEACTDLLSEEGILCATIDDFELTNLSFLLDSTFGVENHLATVCIRSKPQGRAVAEGFSPNHEYGLFYSKSSKSTVGKLLRDEDKLKRYAERDEEGIFAWTNFRGTGANSTRYDRPKLYYPVFINSEGEIRISELEWSGVEWVPTQGLAEGEVELYPIDVDGSERVWSLGWERARQLANTDIVARKNGQGWQIYRKYRPNQEGYTPGTWWDSPKYSASENGTKVLQDLGGFEFSYPKSVTAVQDSLRVSSLKADQAVLDYFPGSGTTFHATQLLNREDGGRRKCLLVEQGGYVYSVILPRIKKIAYGFDWKDGRPRDGAMNGLGVLLKYQRLEQYEEALENIAFTAPAEATQLALAFADYVPKYFLRFETRESPTLVDTAALQNPWAYRLRVWDGYTYDTRQAVDVAETFNYLVGLHVQKNRVLDVPGPEGRPRRYQVVAGRLAATGQRVVVVWRNVTNWTEADYAADRDYLAEALAAHPHDVLYLNHQALLPGYQPVEEVFKTRMIQ